MAAVRPVILVYQDFATVSVPVELPDLNVLLVGPAYRIKDYATDKASIDAGLVGSLTTAPSGAASTGVSLASTNVPAFTTGDIIDSSSAVVYIDTGYAEVAYGTDGVAYTAAPDENKFTSASGAFLTTVAVGDRVVITDVDSGVGVVTIARTVQSVVSNTELRFTSNILVSGTDVTGAAYSGITIATSALKYRVERAVSGLKVNEAATVVATVSPPTVACNSMTVNIGSVAKKVTYGRAYVSYRALRTDLGSDVTEITQTSDITTKLGKIDERNPLAVAAFVAFQNCNKKVQVLGITNDNINGTDNVLVAHTAAKDAVRGRRDVYAIVPLAPRVDVVTMWRNDAVALADPSIAKFRVVIGSYTMPASKTVATGVNSGTTEAGGIDYFYLRDNTATFVTAGVAVGDVVTLSAVNYTVSQVVSEQRLKLAGTNPTLSNINYTVTRNFTAAQKKDELVAVSTSLKSSRCVMVWPDSCSVAGVSNGLTGVASKQNGTYVAAAVGGMTAGLPPHQGFTYVGIAGISQIYNSNTYFYDDQIDALSSGGWYVVVQDSPSSLPYCLHELTTDTTTLETGELMVVKNFDYVSLAYRNALLGYLGSYNVIPETLAFLRSAFNSVTDTLKLRRYPKIGAPLIGATITSVEVLQGSKDQVEIYGAVTLPRPLNRIGLHLTA